VGPSILTKLAGPPPDAAGLALAGERLARRYLERRGYLLLAERYQTRRSLAAGAPQEAVTAEKLRHVEAAAAAWRNAHRAVHRAHRHDVVAVTWTGRRARVEHLRGAGP
jgi:Holliday junction resolvase-like predicted endonuclease